jgi:RHH-type transcriptional regulator, proline utilization regulon repressor / proline dehydrogenase / delta 1-pyrroline-5-carboxylate dehydrogenase
MAAPTGGPGYEFQCLHGMGEPLYDQVVGRGADRLDVACRIYAPVGKPRDAARLPGAPAARERRQHLVRQPIADPAIELDELVQDPVRAGDGGRKGGGAPHPRIPLPRDLFAPAAQLGRLDLNDERDAARAAGGIRTPARRQPGSAAPMLAAAAPSRAGTRAMRNPADAGTASSATCRTRAAPTCDAALAQRAGRTPAWAATAPAAERARLLERRRPLEAHMPN